MRNILHPPPAPPAFGEDDIVPETRAPYVPLTPLILSLTPLLTFVLWHTAYTQSSSSTGSRPSSTSASPVLSRKKVRPRSHLTSQPSAQTLIGSRRSVAAPARPPHRAPGRPRRAQLLRALPAGGAPRLPPGHRRGLRVSACAVREAEPRRPRRL
jgi:hypothetical protein